MNSRRRLFKGLPRRRPPDMLVENLKVRRAGFAFRQEYEAFLERYKLLSPHTWPHWSGLPVEGVTLLLRDLPVHPSEYAFGRTKIFVKNPRTVYELEEFRHERLHELATLIQKTWRGFVMRNKFLRMREGQVTISSNFKCWKTLNLTHISSFSKPRSCSWLAPSVTSIIKRITTHRLPLPVQPELCADPNEADMRLPPADTP
ncbi:unconventional myosin-Ia-like [Ixodes scapularis]